MAHGFGLEVIVGVVRAGLATAKAERTFAAAQPVEVTRLRMTDSGRLALAEQRG
jgi:hypothetical protein